MSLATATISEEIIETKIDNKNKSPLTETAEAIAKKRYYIKDENGNSIEDWNELSWRVVNHVCQNEPQSFKNEMFDIIYNTKFLPNSPCLVNAGRKGNPGCLACFVSRAPDDSWNDMCRNIKTFGDVARRGGGNGVCFSKIRPMYDRVFGSTHAKACGPIEHMRMVSEVMSSITQSGFRGMACMSTLHIWHPDIESFIVCKQKEKALKSLLKEDIFNHYEQLNGRTHEHLNIVLDKFISNFNISVFASDDFMKAVENDESWDLKFNNKVYKTISAKRLFKQIAYNAWRNGDPGLLFEDTINNGPYQYSKQTINATNPCGEQCLPDGSVNPERYGDDGGGSCNLGSIDFSKFVNTKTKKIDWKEFGETVEKCVQFLDNVIDTNKFPTQGFENWAKDNRPVGLGIMGWADALLLLEIAYDSDESIELAEKTIKFMEDKAHAKSVELALQKGTPSACNYKELEYRRNVTLTSIAPTGTISLLAGCSSSIEPIFSPTIYRYDNTGSYVIPHPHSDKEYFRCALDKEMNGKREVNWKDHIRMQAAWQKHCSSAISKTCNLPNSATTEDVEQAYMLAWKSGCKGITVYRDGCKTTQVLNTSQKANALGVSNAPQRPKELPAKIYNITADWMEWHIIFGLMDGVPYEIFAVNGKQELPANGIICKQKQRHYSLLDENRQVLIDNITQEEKNIDPSVDLETRRFSLELRHGIPPKFIVDQIDKSNKTLTSFSKAVSRILKKHFLTDEELNTISKPCPECSKKGTKTQMISESGCWKCPIPECGFAKCS